MADVARLAGVSLSTVSYAITGVRPISSETRERIERAMRELRYTPNALAQGLASKRSRILALLFPTSERGLSLTDLEFILGAAERASKSGYHVLLWTAAEDSVDELRHLTHRGLVDGVLVMAVRLVDERINMLREADVPFAAIGHPQDTAGVNFADTDFVQTTRVAVEYLAGLGHRDIAVLNQSRATYDRGYGPAVRFESGVVAAARSANVRTEVCHCDSNHQAGRETFGLMIERSPEITAVVSMNEPAVVGLMAEASEYGWRIPRDLSVVSVISSGRTAEMTIPPLTTVSPPARDMAAVSIEALIRRIEEDSSVEVHTYQQSTLVVRGTSGPPRAGDSGQS